LAATTRGKASQTPAADVAVLEGDEVFRSYAVRELAAGLLALAAG